MTGLRRIVKTIWMEYGVFWWKFSKSYYYWDSGECGRCVAHFGEKRLLKSQEPTRPTPLHWLSSSVLKNRISLS